MNTETYLVNKSLASGSWLSTSYGAEVDFNIMVGETVRTRLRKIALNLSWPQSVEPFNFSKFLKVQNEQRKKKKKAKQPRKRGTGKRWKSYLDIGKWAWAANSIKETAITDPDQFSPPACVHRPNYRPLHSPLDHIWTITPRPTLLKAAWLLHGRIDASTWLFKTPGHGEFSISLNTLIYVYKHTMCLVLIARMSF